MYRIIRAETRAEYREFFAFSGKCGYGRDESTYLERYASPVLNPIKTEERAYLYAVSDGCVMGRLITWKDRARDRVTGENRGFFALCDALTPECGVLIEHMLKLQCEWGSDDVIGPVSPDGSGFFNGMPKEMVPGIMNSPAQAVNLPEQYGFNVYSRNLSGMIEIAQERPAEKMAEAAKQRFGLRVRPLERRMLNDELPACAADFAPTGLKTMAARQAERIAGLVDRKLSFEALAGDGKRAGYILTLRGMPPRITTLITSDGVFRPAVTCVLLDALQAEMLKRGVRFAEVGVIDSENTASRLLAEYCKWTVRNEYKVYIQQIN